MPEPSGQRFALGICQFEGHGSACFLLDDRGPQSHCAAEDDIADPKANQVATSQPAVYRQVEHGEVAYAMVMLKPSSNSPDMTRLQWGLGTNQAPRVPSGTLSNFLMSNLHSASSSGGRIHSHHTTSQRFCRA